MRLSELLLVVVLLYFVGLGGWTVWKLLGYDAGRFLVGVLAAVGGSVSLLYGGPVGLLYDTGIVLAVLGFANALYTTFRGGRHARQE